MKVTKETDISTLLRKYTEALVNLYGIHLKSIILYGSYARGDYTEDSDIDIMILLDMPDHDIKEHWHELSGLTYDFNMEYGLDIKPIVKNEGHFEKWVFAYPFYSNISKEGVKLYGAA